MIGDAPDGYDALLYIKRLHDRGQAVNVILTETRNNGVDGAQATRIIKDEFPEIAILVLTDNLNDSYVIDAIHAGAGGYISETKPGNPIDEAKFGTGAIVSIVKSKQSTFWLAVIE